MLLQVALAGGHASMRRDLAELLNEQPSLSVVRSVQTLDELRYEPGDAPSDLVLLDVQLPDTATVLGARSFRQESPQCGLILHTTQANAATLVAATIANASGHLVKALDGAAFARALTGIHQRGSSGSRISSSLVRWYEVGLGNARPGFTADEFSLLRLISDGHSDFEITSRLRIDYPSLQQEVGRLYSTLSTRPDLRALGAQLAQVLSG
jgi:DNA-binding NarL/FixJ family response regulator